MALFGPLLTRVQLLVPTLHTNSVENIALTALMPVVLLVFVAIQLLKQELAQEGIFQLELLPQSPLEGSCSAILL